MMSAKPDPTATIPRTGRWPGNRRGIQRSDVSHVFNRCPHWRLKWKTQHSSASTTCQPQTPETISDNFSALIYAVKALMQTNHTTCCKLQDKLILIIREIKLRTLSNAGISFSCIHEAFITCKEIKGFVNLNIYWNDTKVRQKMTFPDNDERAKGMRVFLFDCVL